MDDSAECDQDGVIIVESELQPQQHVLQPQGSVSSAVRMIQGQSFSSESDHSRIHIQPSVSQGEGSSTFLREPSCAIVCFSFLVS